MCAVSVGDQTEGGIEMKSMDRVTLGVVAAFFGMPIMACGGEKEPAQSAADESSEEGAEEMHEAHEEMHEAAEETEEAAEETEEAAEEAEEDAEEAADE